jgi:hypothetical protein
MGTEVKKTANRSGELQMIWTEMRISVYLSKLHITQWKTSHIFSTVSLHIDRRFQHITVSPALLSNMFTIHNCEFKCTEITYSLVMTHFQRKAIQLVILELSWLYSFFKGNSHCKVPTFHLCHKCYCNVPFGVWSYLLPHPKWSFTPRQWNGRVQTVHYIGTSPRRSLGLNSQPSYYCEATLSSADCYFRHGTDEVYV